MANIVRIDGAQGEGGGQILRTSLALSLITGRPFQLQNIRARRQKPGLQPQHLMSVQAATAIGRATVRGASLQSTSLTFEPGEVMSGNYHFRIGTAGATSLVLHTIYLPLALADGKSAITIEGGTHVKASPCFHFLETTWRSYMSRIGIAIALRMDRTGFYPRGGGLIEAKIAGSAQPRGLEIAKLDDVERITGISAVAGLPPSIARRQAERVRRRLAKRNVELEIGEESWPGGPGTAVLLMVETQPTPTLFFALGERGKPAEKVADEAVDQVNRFLDAAPLGLDAHSADQLLLPLSLAEGPSNFHVAEVSQHLLTNAEVVRLFVDREIKIEGADGEAAWVRIGVRRGT